MTQEPTLVNDPEVYGNELKIKTELKQTVTTADGSSVCLLYTSDAADE